MAYNLITGTTSPRDWSLGSTMRTIPSKQKRQIWANQIAKSESGGLSPLPAAILAIAAGAGVAVILTKRR